MRSTLIYDLPTRLFHWLFSGLFLLSFVISKTVSDESVIFYFHMIFGLLLGGLVIWRLIWGVVGSEHARFSGFKLSPTQLKEYLLGTLSGSNKSWPGHNPASSWAAMAMFLLSLGLAATGYLMSTGSKEEFEDLHELMANSFIMVVVLHVAGLILHSIRHQDSIVLSMIDGKKETSELDLSIKSPRLFAAFLLLVFFLSSSIFLFKSFNHQTRTLKLFGKTLQLEEKI